MIRWVEVEGWLPEPGYHYGGLAEGNVPVGQYPEYADWLVTWCKLTRVAPGTAAVYPYKFELPLHGNEGQFKASEVQGWRCDVDLLEQIVKGRPHYAGEDALTRLWDAAVVAPLRR